MAQNGDGQEVASGRITIELATTLFGSFAMFTQADAEYLMLCAMYMYEEIDMQNFGDSALIWHFCP